MKKKNKSFYIILIVLVLFGVSIGYSAINRTLNITGNSEVKENTWDLHLENVKVKSGSVEPVEDIKLNNDNLSINFNFLLSLPGDFYEFTVDVVNKGSIDAMIDSIVKTPTLTDAQKKYMNYIIEYQNGEQITSKQLVPKNNGFVRIKVRVEYRSDVLEADMPTTNQTIDLGFTLNYVQADDTSNPVTNNGASSVTFYIGQYVCEYEPGMTWEDWCNSEYNILELDTLYGTVGVGMLHSVSKDGVLVSPEDLIDGSVQYSIAGY